MPGSESEDMPVYLWRSFRLLSNCTTPKEQEKHIGGVYGGRTNRTGPPTRLRDPSFQGLDTPRSLGLLT